MQHAQAKLQSSGNKTCQTSCRMQVIKHVKQVSFPLIGGVYCRSMKGICCSGGLSELVGKSVQSLFFSTPAKIECAGVIYTGSLADGRSLWLVGKSRLHDNTILHIIERWSRSSVRQQTRWRKKRAISQTSSHDSYTLHQLFCATSSKLGATNATRASVCNPRESHMHTLSHQRSAAALWKVHWPQRRSRE